MFTIVTAIKASCNGYKQWLRTSLLLLLCVAVQAKSHQLYSDLATLTSLPHAGREAGSDKPNISAQFLFERFSELGLNTEFQKFAFKEGFFSQAHGHNVIAQLPCNTLPCGKVVVISAHYDHLGINGSKIYAGANDNASGTAALLTIAEQLKKAVRHSPVVLLATDAEEKGLHGAKHFVATIDSLAKYALNINLDMLALNKKNTLYIMQSSGARPYTQTLSKLNNNNFKVKLVSAQRMKRQLGGGRIDWLRASDHYAFYRAGMPYLYFGMGEDKNHHSTKDTLQAMDFEKYQHVVMFISDFIVALLRCPSKCTS
ncbi:M28 family peptidase [Pseudoalteromonas holothuriae]|uniref:M28 family peptidase n=1 Tax=Pseudoalteromonas holothuriae TaxID=2963714 RepID=UPI0021BF5FF2|nr:M28 family peptidase [Pseudoalteromonas sp. CIP111854]